MSEDDPYTYPGSTVLRNKLDLTDAAQLARLERRLVTQRATEGIPPGGFDLAHLRAIHRHFFQDVYDWAGELRTVEIAKGGHQFQFRRFIETSMQDVHQRLARAAFLHGLRRADFATAAGADHGRRELCSPFPRGERADPAFLSGAVGRAGRAPA